MPERTRCSCGNTYRLDDDLTGEEIRCVGCGEMLRVGEDSRRESDRPKRRYRDDDDDRDDRDDRPARKRKRRRRNRSSGPLVESWVLDLVGGGVLAVVALLVLVLALVSPPMGTLAYGLGVMISLVGGLWLLVIAFNDGPTTGFMCLCVPFYSLVFIASNFDDCKRPFFIQLLGFLLMLVGGIQAPQ